LSLAFVDRARNGEDITIEIRPFDSNSLSDPKPNKAGRIGGDGFTPKVIWAIVKANAKSCGLPKVAPHDLRRTFARLCHQAGGELEQIQFPLGHVSV
jgi:integrase